MNILFFPDLSFHNIDINSKKYENIQKFFNTIILEKFPNSYKIINLEVNSKKRNSKKELALKFGNKEASFLKKIGIKGVCLANNHTFDKGIIGYNNIKNKLKKNGIASFGAGPNLKVASKPLILKKNFTKVGLFGLSYKPESDLHNYGVFSLKKEESIKKINHYKKKNNLKYLIAYCHSGIELFSYPLIRDEKLYKKMIRNKVDLVIGSHPHIIQKFQIYKNKFIFYSIGDLLFGSDINAQYKRITKLPAHGHYFKKVVNKNKLTKSLMLSITINKKLLIEVYEIKRNLDFSFKIEKIKYKEISKISKNFAKALKKRFNYRQFIEKKIFKNG